MSGLTHSENLTIVGMFLRDERDRRGISMGKLAAKVGVSKTFVSMVERGWSTPSVENASKWFHALRLTVEQRREIVKTWGAPVFEHADGWQNVAEGG